MKAWPRPAASSGFFWPCSCASAFFGRRVLTGAASLAPSAAGTASTVSLTAAATSTAWRPGRFGLAGLFDLLAGAGPAAGLGLVVGLGLRFSFCLGRSGFFGDRQVGHRRFGGDVSLASSARAPLLPRRLRPPRRLRRFGCSPASSAPSSSCFGGLLRDFGKLRRHSAPPRHPVRHPGDVRVHRGGDGDGGGVRLRLLHLLRSLGRDPRHARPDPRLPRPPSPLRAVVILLVDDHRCDRQALGSRDGRRSFRRSSVRPRRLLR